MRERERERPKELHQTFAPNPVFIASCHLSVLWALAHEIFWAEGVECPGGSFTLLALIQLLEKLYPCIQNSNAKI